MNCHYLKIEDYLKDEEKRIETCIERHDKISQKHWSILTWCVGILITILITSFSYTYAQYSFSQNSQDKKIEECVILSNKNEKTISVIETKLDNILEKINTIQTDMKDIKKEIKDYHNASR